MLLRFNYIVEMYLNSFIYRLKKLISQITRNPSIFLKVFNIKKIARVIKQLLNVQVSFRNLKKEKFCGSFIHLNTISNNFFKISKFNIFFTFIKKFIFVGNIFLPSNYSNTYIEIKGKKTFIYSKRKHSQKIIIPLY